MPDLFGNELSEEQRSRFREGLNNPTSTRSPYITRWLVRMGIEKMGILGIEHTRNPQDIEVLTVKFAITQADLLALSEEIQREFGADTEVNTRPRLP